VAVERDPALGRESVPNAHVSVRLHAGGIYVAPCSYMTEKGDRGGGKGGGAVGVLVWGELPLASLGEVLGFDQGKSEMGGGI